VGAVFTVLLVLFIILYSIDGLTRVFINQTVHVVAEENYGGYYGLDHALNLDDFYFQFGFGFQTSGYFPKEYGHLVIKHNT